MRAFALALCLCVAGCSKSSSTPPKSNLEFDTTRPEVPFVMIHRFPAYPAPGQKTVAGAIVAVWQDGRIVRIASESAVGKTYVKGQLSPAQLDEVKQFMRSHTGLFEAKEGGAPTDAASEVFGIRFQGRRLYRGEPVGGMPQVVQSADRAALRAYLLSLEIAAPQPTGSPWRFPAEDWYR